MQKRARHLLLYLLLLIILFVRGFEPDNSLAWKSCELYTKQITDYEQLQSVTDTEHHWLHKLYSEEHENVRELRRLLRKTQLDYDVNMTQQPTTSSSAETTTNGTECTFIKLPLQWEVPSDTRHIQLFVKRVRSRNANRKGQLWLLQGGPGGSGLVFDKLAESYRDYLEDYDIMIPDHRGTGRSSLLGKECFKKGKLAFSDCFLDIYKEYGTGIRGFGTTMAAHDIIHVAKLANMGSDRIVIYGTSYGTFWLNRILTIYPNEVHMAIADSVVSANMDFTERDDHYLEAGNEFTKICKANQFCSSKFQGGLDKTVTDLLVKQDQPTKCRGAYEHYPTERVKRILAILLANIDTRKLIFPFLYRLNRCNAKDKTWLDNFGYIIRTLYNIKPTGGDLTDVNTPTININPNVLYVVAGSEISNNPPLHDKQYWVNRFKNNTRWYHINLSVSIMENVDHMGSHRYSESLQRQYSSYRKPLLVMHGSLDPQTPQSFGREWQQAYNLNETFVWIPNAVHGVIISTIIPGMRLPAGAQVMLQWIKSNGTTVNTTLITKWRDYQMSFEQMNEDLLKKFTLSTALWEGGPTSTYQDVIFTTRIFIILSVSFICLVIIAILIFMIVIIVKCINRRRQNQWKNNYNRQLTDEVVHGEDEYA